jgi:hypothetical protein
MKRIRRIAASLAWGACLASPAPVRAQSAADLATAESLFTRGAALVSSGHYDEGCPLLERAQKLVMGIGVTLYVGQCYEQRGELLHAWEQFTRAEQLAATRGDRRRSVARARAEGLRARLARIRLVVAAGSDASDLVITDDDVVVPRADWATERPVEPGVHRIRASAPGRESRELAVEVPAGAVAVPVEIPPLHAASSAPASGAVAAPLSAPGAPVSMPASQTVLVPATGPTSAFSSQRIAALTALGLGAIGISLGAAFGVDAKAKLDDSNASGRCQPNDHCDANGLAERRDALTSATLSTVSFVAGGAFLAGGVALYVSAPRREATLSLVPRADSRGATLLIQRSW